MEWVLLPCYSLSSKGHESEYVRVIGPPAGCISNITNGSIGAGCSSSIMDRGSSTPLISFLKKQVVKPIWKTNHHISPPARWRSIDFNKGATPSSLPSFLPSFPPFFFRRASPCASLSSLRARGIASSVKWSNLAPEADRELQFSLGTHGPEHMPERMPDRMSSYVR